MLTTGKQLTIEEAKEYNRQIWDYRSKAIVDGTPTGCISTLACENCGILVSDSICLCMGIFTCPNCEYETKGLKYTDVITHTLFTDELNKNNDMFDLDNIDGMGI